MPKRESAKRVWLITYGTACPSITHEVCTEGWVEVDTSRDTNSKLRGLPIELCLLIAQTDPLVGCRRFLLRWLNTLQKSVQKAH